MMARFIKAFLGCLALVFCALPALAQGPEMISSMIEGKERVCLDCHRLPNIQTNEGVLTAQALCLECHAKATAIRKVGDRSLSLQVTLDSFGKNRHGRVACMECHTDVARSPHKTSAGAQCLGCHPVHGERKSGDPHLRVSCQACHRQSKISVLDQKTDRIKLSAFDQANQPLSLTDHRLPEPKDKDFCLKCHFPRNPVGAAASVLPGKSVLCIVCHNAPMAVGHPIFWMALIVFIIGMILVVLFWFQGGIEGEDQTVQRKIAFTSDRVWTSLFSREGRLIIKTAFFDGLLQRRLLQESVERWSIHSLIFLSFLLRMALSLFTALAYRLGPNSSLATALIDKNHPLVAFSYDLLGLLILLGLFWAAIRRYISPPPHRLSEGQDNFALAIIGILVILGFLVEGARILMTRIPPEIGVYSFVGYPLSRLLALFPMDWQCWYGYLWWGHALAGAVFIASIPFGKMKHMFLTPLTLILNAKRK